MELDWEQKAIIDLAKKLHTLGFVVYVAKSKRYGFYTDEKGERVVCFELDFSQYRFGGNYVPSVSSGSGWNITKAHNLNVITTPWAKNVLYACAPSWANRDPQYLPLRKYLTAWRASNYELFKG